MHACPSAEILCAHTHNNSGCHGGQTETFESRNISLFSPAFYQLMIPEDSKCNFNASGIISMSTPTTCGPSCIKFYHLTCGSHSRHLGFKGKGRVYLSTRLSHHPKTVASFQLTRLALSGDVCPNPGPGTSARNINKPKCNTCERTVARNHRVVRCQSCRFLYHIKCASLTLKDYHWYESGMNRSWMCVCCLFSALPRDPSFISLNDSINSSYTTEDMDDDPQQDYNERDIAGF